MKTLAIITTGLQRFERSELLRRESADEFPRVSLFATTLNAEMVDEEYLMNVPSWRRRFYKIVPPFAAQVFEAYLNRNNYDAVLSWSERRAFLFALLLKLTRSKTKHIALLYWMSKRKQAALLRFAHSHIDRIITWTTVQRDFAINVLGIAPSKIVFIRHPVDQKFWRPIDGPATMICAVGSEMRDYPTLIAAMEGLDIRCHIATGTIRIITNNTAVTKRIEELGDLPGNITAGQKPYPRLRELYAQSRFVVVPLYPSDTDNGINAILEGMAMGKAVICSRTKGQVDVIEEGTTGIFVPVGDPKALREAILYLWNHPEIAGEMGRKGRKFIEEHHTLDQFVGSVRNVVEEITGKQYEPHRSGTAGAPPRSGNGGTA